MVYPHSNDIGKEKPKPPANPSFNLDMLIAESWEPPLISQNAHKALMGMPLSTYQFVDPKPNPVLIDGPKANYKFAFWGEKPGSPVVFELKKMRIEMRVAGISKTLTPNKLWLDFPLPDHEIKESELRDILKKSFQHLEDLIISEIKKEKGIK